MPRESRIRGKLAIYRATLACVRARAFITTLACMTRETTTPRNLILDFNLETAAAVCSPLIKRWMDAIRVYPAKISVFHLNTGISSPCGGEEEGGGRSHGAASSALGGQIKRGNMQKCGRGKCQIRNLPCRQIEQTDIASDIYELFVAAALSSLAVAYTPPFLLDHLGITLE